MTAQAVDLFGPVAGDLATIESEILRDIASDPPEVSVPMAELFKAGGKRIRPALVLLTAKIGNYDLRTIKHAAMAVEMAHAATLVHDDVIDRAKLRRGTPTVSAQLGDESAIVIGDYYLAKAYSHADRANSPDVVGTLARAVMGICAGEVRQQSIKYRYSTDVEEYMGRIEAKTGFLLADCCRIGALVGGLNDAVRSNLKEYGHQLGFAFQIADDVLDYTGSEGQVGKPIGHDIVEGFATLPFLLSGVHVEDGRKLDDQEARSVVEAVRDSDGPRQALEIAREHSNKAKRELKLLPRSQAVTALDAIADYVVSRKF